MGSREMIVSISTIFQNNLNSASRSDPGLQSVQLLYISQTTCIYDFVDLLDLFTLWLHNTVQCWYKLYIIILSKFTFVAVFTADMLGYGSLMMFFSTTAFFISEAE